MPQPSETTHGGLSYVMEYGAYVLLVVIGGLIARGRAVFGLLRNLWDWGYAVFTGASALKRTQAEYATRLQELTEALTAIRNVVAPAGEPTTRDMLIRTQADVAGALAGMVQLSAQVTLLMDEMDEPRFHCSPDGGCIMANHALCELFGRAPSEMHGNNWLEAVHHEDRARVYSGWRNAVTEDLPWEAVYRVVSETRETYVRAKGRAIRDRDGAIVMYAGSVQPLASTGQSDAGQPSAPAPVPHV